LNKSKISQEDDDLFNKQKENKDYNKNARKSKILPKDEDFKILIALNNSVSENKSSQIDDLKNKLEKSSLKVNPNTRQINPTKNEINYQKIQKNNQVENRSKTPNQPIFRKENVIKQEKNISIHKPNPDNLNGQIFINKIENSDKKNYNNLILNTDENKYSNNLIKGMDIKINKINQNRINYNSKENKLPTENNYNYIKLNINENPKYKNIYNPQIYNKIQSKNQIESEKIKNLNVILEPNKNITPIRAISARVNRNENINASNKKEENYINNNINISKNFNSNPLSKNLKEKENDILMSKLIDNKNKIIMNLFNNNLESNNLNNHKNQNSKINILSKENINQLVRPISTRDRVLVNPNGYNVLSKNTNIINQNHLLNSQNINNYNKNINLIKRDILIYNEKFNLISPIRIGDNLKKPIHNNLLNNENFLNLNNINNQKFQNLEKNNNFNIKFNKPINISHSRK